jgi:hypothetical protein
VGGSPEIKFWHLRIFLELLDIYLNLSFESSIFFMH